MPDISFLEKSLSKKLIKDLYSFLIGKEGIVGDLFEFVDHLKMRGEHDSLFYNIEENDLKEPLILSYLLLDREFFFHTILFCLETRNTNIQKACMRVLTSQDFAALWEENYPEESLEKKIASLLVCEHKQVAFISLLFRYQKDVGEEFFHDMFYLHLDDCSEGVFCKKLVYASVIHYRNCKKVTDIFWKKEEREITTMFFFLSSIPTFHQIAYLKYWMIEDLPRIYLKEEYDELISGVYHRIKDDVGIYFHFKHMLEWMNILIVKGGWDEPLFNLALYPFINPLQLTFSFDEK